MMILFVYNAKSGGLNSLLDFGHKVISPSTYQCKLCMLTHSSIGERKEWQQFKASINVTMEFHHIDEFEKKYNSAFEYPIILKINNSKLEPLINHETINQTNDLAELIGKIKKAL